MEQRFEGNGGGRRWRNEKKENERKIKKKKRRAISLLRQNMRDFSRSCAGK